jgi:hypothetical protein
MDVEFFPVFTLEGTPWNLTVGDSRRLGSWIILRGFPIYLVGVTSFVEVTIT